MFQLPQSQVVHYHSSYFDQVTAFNIRIYDRPINLQGEMWQVRWYRVPNHCFFGDEYPIHTEWNERREVCPADEFIYDAESEQVCIEGWEYYWEDMWLRLPIEYNYLNSGESLIVLNQSGITWSRDSLGDVLIEFVGE